MENDKIFSKAAAISFGWETMKNNFWFLVGVYLVIVLINSLSNIFDEGLADWLFTIVGTVLSLITGMGAIKIVLALYDGGQVRFSDLFSNYQRFFRVLGASILITIICVIGFILLIVPGIILALRLQFTIFLIMDEDLGAVEALKKSWEITRGSAGNLFLFWLLCLLIIILGFIALVVGVLVAAPVTYLGLTYIYRQFNPRGAGQTLSDSNSTPLLYEK
ncbi:MAG: glycerophosphoryl diester phosphodiesterase membrane domain-containing protein [Methylocystaceae bacterium]